MKLSAVLLGVVCGSYPTYTIPLDNIQLEWANQDNMMEFLEHENAKPFVRYQSPDDEYVPIVDLPIVYLNGHKFHRQGKLPRPNMLDRFTKSTRTTTGQMVCSGADDAAEHRRLMKQEKEDKAPRDNKGLGNIVARKLDVSARLFQAEYPRYNGQLAPLPYNELTKPGMNLAALEPLNDEEQEISRNPLLDFVELDPLQGGMASDVFFEPAEDMSLIASLVDEETIDFEPRTAEEREMDREALRLKKLSNSFYKQEKVQIGCCNGTPYNSKKRCCCRRVSFDKDQKFCCAINGCENFKIFDRDNAQHYKDCLSLSGLVIQEYGYQGMAGQPQMSYKSARRIPGK